MTQRQKLVLPPPKFADFQTPSSFPTSLFSLFFYCKFPFFFFYVRSSDRVRVGAEILCMTPSPSRRHARSHTSNHRSAYGCFVRPSRPRSPCVPAFFVLPPVNQSPQSCVRAGFFSSSSQSSPPISLSSLSSVKYETLSMFRILRAFCLLDCLKMGGWGEGREFCGSCVFIFIRVGAGYQCSVLRHFNAIFFRSPVLLFGHRCQILSSLMFDVAFLRC